MGKRAADALLLFGNVCREQGVKSNGPGFCLAFCGRSIFSGHETRSYGCSRANVKSDNFIVALTPDKVLDLNQKSSESFSDNELA